MDVFTLLPENKHDDSTVSQLLSLSDVEIKSILPELLTWVQDLNWPISGDMIRVISKHSLIAEPYVLDVLRGTDEVWKYNILSALLYEWPTEPGSELMNEIARIARYPTPEETADEVDRAADEFLRYKHQDMNDRILLN